MKIGAVEIPGYAGLAPMAGVGDHAMRTLCREFGAGYVVSEMASAKGFTMKGQKTAQLLAVTEPERPMGIQIFGDNPAIMAEAARSSLVFSPDIIDINMGCPAPKIAGNGGGSALMKNPALAGEIIRAVSSAVDIPVTVKFRKGWDDNSVNAVEFAQIAEVNGAAAVTVHGRTKTQMYAPPVDWEIIRQVKNAVSIPVIANGDVTDVESARAIYQKTGADYILIGRGACGAPWVFSQINQFFKEGLPPVMPTLYQRLAIMMSHMEQLCTDKGERIGMKEARKHCAWYMKGQRGAAHYRKEMGSLETMENLKELVDNILENSLSWE